MEKPWLKFYDPHVPPSLEYPAVPLTKVLDDAADQFAGNLGVFFFGGKVTYGELRARANQFAGALKGIGFRRGSRLGVLVANMPQAIISAFGAWKAGAEVAFLDPLAENEELLRQITETGVEALVALDLILPRVDPIFSKTQVKNFIITGVKDFLPFPRDLLFSLAAKGKGIHVKVARKPNVHLFKEWILTGRSDTPPEEINPEATAAIFYTRGTSGRPKGVLLAHRNLLANLLQISTWLGKLEMGREGFVAIPPFHQPYGLMMGMLLPVSLAALSLQMPRFETLQVLQEIKKHQPSFFPASPEMIERLATYLGIEKYKISSIKTFWSTGQALPEEDLQNFERRVGRKVSEGFGLTEAAAFTHLNPMAGKRKTGSIGLPLPDTEAKIVAPANSEREMPAGESGELIIRGPQVMKGYLGGPEETSRVIRDGWLHTGDLARMDEEGYFFLAGRVGK